MLFGTGHRSISVQEMGKSHMAPGLQGSLIFTHLKRDSRVTLSTSRTSPRIRNDVAHNSCDIIDDDLSWEKPFFHHNRHRIPHTDQKLRWQPPICTIEEPVSTCPKRINLVSLTLNSSVLNIKSVCLKVQGPWHGTWTSQKVIFRFVA